MTEAQKKRGARAEAKWEVVSMYGEILCTGLNKREAENKIENDKRIGVFCSMRRTRKLLPPDIGSLDAGDDE